MSRFLMRMAFALATLAVFTQIVPAQTPQTAAARDARSVTLNIVTTPAGEELSPQDFHLLDNKAPRDLTSVRRVLDAKEPAHVIVVVDAVNLPFTRVAYVRDQVEKYLKQDGGHLANPTTFAVVTDKTTEVQPNYTQDGTALSDALKTYPMGLREIRRDQGVWGANERTQISLKALTELTAYAAKTPGRKLLLWVSGGWPLLSGIRIDLDDKQHEEVFRDVVQYSRQLRLAKVTLYNVNPLGPEENLAYANYYESFLKGVRKPTDTEIADLSLQVLSAQTGGLVFTSTSDVAGNLAKAIADTKSWYEVTFTAPPAERPDEYHQVEVNISRPDVKARTRNGYYAQP